MRNNASCLLVAFSLNVLCQVSLMRCAKLHHILCWTSVMCILNFINALCEIYGGIHVLNGKTA